VAGKRKDASHGTNETAVSAGVPSRSCAAGPRRTIRERRCSEPGLQRAVADNWTRQQQLDRHERDDGLTSAEREELRKLRCENVRLKQEREILKRAAAFFAAETETR
jgi:hypothetical protein